MLSKVTKVVRETLSEPGTNGTLSWGRVASSVFGLATLVWVSRILYMTHGLPAMDGITTFVLGPYGANKIATAAQAYSQNPVSVVQTAQYIQPPQVPVPPQI
jgi:hypothetical protein